MDNAQKIRRIKNKLATFLLCPDILLQIFAHFSRPKLCTIELTCWAFHVVVQSDYLRPVYEISKTLVVRTPKTVKIKKVVRNGGRREVKEIEFGEGYFTVVHSTLGREFDMADFIIKSDNIVHLSENINELPPKFVRALMFQIWDLHDSRVLQFLESIKYVFTCNTYTEISPSIKYPLSASTWIQMFAAIPICDIRIRTLYDRANQGLVERKNKELAIIARKLKNREIDSKQYKSECLHIIEKFNLAIGIQKYTNVECEQISNAMFRWLHDCRCAQKHKKYLHFADEGHMLSPLVGKLLKMMHDKIIQKGCVTTQNRQMRIYISSQFIYEIFEDIPFQFDVNNRVIVQNLQNEEMLEIKWKEYIWQDGLNSELWIDKRTIE